MENVLKMLQAAWPGILLIAGICGTIVGWLVTRTQRQQTSAAQTQTIEVYRENLKAKDELAQTLAESTMRQIEALNHERKESDLRHEEVIKEYRDRTHALRGELQQKSNECALHMVELADLRARTDFKPVMEFQQSWYAESQQIHKQMMESTKQMTETSVRCAEIMAVVAPLLKEVSNQLRELIQQKQDKALA